MRASPAMLVAIAALIAAMAGGGYAATTGLITSANITNNSVASADIKNGTITENDLSPAVRRKLGRTGARGPQGPPGPAGPAGLPVVAAASGGVSPSKLSYVTGPTVTIPVGEVGSAQAFCPPGTKVTGGGGFNSISNYASGGSTFDGSGWYVVVNNDTLIDVDISAFAVCVAA